MVNVWMLMFCHLYNPAILSFPTVSKTLANKLPPYCVIGNLSLQPEDLSFLIPFERVNTATGPRRDEIPPQMPWLLPSFHILIVTVTISWGPTVCQALCWILFKNSSSLTIILFSDSVHHDPQPQLFCPTVFSLIPLLPAVYGLFSTEHQEITFKNAGALDFSGYTFLCKVYNYLVCCTPETNIILCQL